MISFERIISKLNDNEPLSAEEFKLLLTDNDLKDNAILRQEAQKAAISSFGRNIYIRGLIEISNYCRNGCLYCGIRAENKKLTRYRLSKDEILECCGDGYQRGFRTFVLQGGEDPLQTDEWVTELVAAIRMKYPDCAITLSLGEKSEKAYKMFRDAGADRYLLRHETFNAEHYARIHPSGMSRDNRLACLTVLKSLGYQTGAGIMVGSPYQSIDNIVEDLLYIQELRPEMIGTGPFIHHPDTPFAGFEDGDVGMTLKLISIFRLMDPKALIPATTALATLDRSGHVQGILAGANVVMPNLSPASRRRDYSLYEGKASSGSESAEGLEELKKELETIDYKVIVGRGDYMV